MVGSDVFPIYQFVVPFLGDIQQFSWGVACCFDPAKLVANTAISSSQASLMLLPKQTCTVCPTAHGASSSETKETIFAKRVARLVRRGNGKHGMAKLP